MGEFASNAKANTGVALGATGLGIAVANALGNNCGVGGLLNGIFGGCRNNSAEMQYISQLQSENAMLKSENYSDKVGKEVYSQGLTDNRLLRTEMYAALNPLIGEAHQNAISVARLEEQFKCCCEKQELNNKILDQKIDSQVNLLTGKINEAALALNGKIDSVDAKTQGQITSLNQTIACISGKVDDITTTSVQFCKICPQPVPAAATVPATGTSWYPGCVSPIHTTTTTPAA